MNQKDYLAFNTFSVRVGCVALDINNVFLIKKPEDTLFIKKHNF